MSTDREDRIYNETSIYFISVSYISILKMKSILRNHAEKYLPREIFLIDIESR